MPDDIAASTARDGRFGQALAELLQAEERGEPLDLERVLKECPDLETPLREFFRDRDGFNRLAGCLDRTRQADAPLVELAPGSRLAGYEVIEEVGHGGRGIVYRVTDPEMNRPLAVKVLRPELQGEPDAVCRFLEEAQVTGQLQHPGIVPVHAIGRLPDGSPYLVMKLIQGRTLAALLAERPAPAHDLPAFLSIFQQVCQAVAYAHSRGVIHRDLKPANIMVGAFAEVQVMDWGLAKVLAEGVIAAEAKGPGQGGATQASTVRTVRTESTGLASVEGTVAGTFAYMSPEQAGGRVEEIDRRADVFGLGAVLCEVLIGRPPCAAAPAWRLPILAEGSDLADAFARLDGCGADAGLVRLCQECLARDRGNRPRDAGVVAERLAAYLAEVQVRLRQAELDRAAALVKAAEERKRRKLAVALAASVFTLALVGGSVAWGLINWRHTTAGRIEIALNEAGTLRARAQAAPVDDQTVIRWSDAEAAAHRLDDLLAQGFPSADLWQRVREFNAVLYDEAAAARRQAEEVYRARLFRSQLALVRSLKEVEFLDKESYRASEGRPTSLSNLKKAELLDNKEDFPKLDTEGQYRRVFADYGLDLDNLTTEEAARQLLLRPREIHIEVAAALDDWALERRRLNRPAAEWQRLVALARAVDQDAWRTALRSLDYTAIGKERRTLLELADTANVPELPPPSVELLARALRAAGERERAELVLREAQNLHPGDVWINYQLAETLQDRPALNGDEIIRFYTAARAIRPEIGIALGNALYNAGKMDQAVATYAQVAKLRPGNPVLHIALGRALLRKMDPEGAEREYGRAIELNPNNAIYHHALAQALRSKKDMDGAIREYSRAIELDATQSESHNGLGNVLSDKQDLEGAIREYHLAIELKHHNALAHYNLGNALVKKKDLIGAITEYRAAIDIKPKFEEAYYNLGNTLLIMKDLDGAIKTWRSAIELDDKDVKAHCNLGNALLAKKDVESAVKEFHHAIDIDPKSAIAYCGLGDALHAKKELDAAVRAYKYSIDLDRNVANPHNNLGNVLLEQKDVEGAQKEFLEAIRLDLDHSLAGPHNGLGNVLMVKKDLDGAIREYRAAIDSDFNEPALHRNLGKALLNKKDLEGAIVEFRIAIKLDCNDPFVHSDLGNALQDTRDWDGADKEYRAALMLGLNTSAIHNSLGNVLLFKKDLDGAIQEYRAAIEIDPGDPMLYSNLGLAFRHKQDLDAAEKEYRAAIKIDHSLATAHNGLGIVLREKKDLEGAIQEYRIAIGIDKNDPSFHNNLGNALRKKKDLEEAIKEFRAAVDLDPDNPFRHFSLANALRETGHLTDSLSAFREGHRLGIAQPGWPHPSASWVREMEQLVELDRKLPAFLRGKDKPANLEDRVALAQLCREPFKKLYAGSARLYAEALADKPELANEPRNNLRYNAARAAALAGCGVGDDAGGLEEKERTRLRDQARDWLKADLALWAKRVDGGDAKAREAVHEQMKQWQCEADLAGVRDQTELANLPKMERETWEQFWAEVETLRKQVHETK
jgi:serine/threonine-protein kinase